jgi:thiol-disulfide isomerase/thioredoxin
VNTLSTVLAVLAAAFGLWFVAAQVFAWRAARRAVGQPVPAEAAAAGNRVYYFHAAHCGFCRALTPRMQALAAKHPNLVLVDTAAAPDLAAAFGVAATPTFCHAVDGTIRDVRLGAVSPSWLTARLTPEHKPEEITP